MKRIMQIETGAKIRRQNLATLGSHFWKLRPIASGISIPTRESEMFLKGISVAISENKLRPNVNSQSGIITVIKTFQNQQKQKIIFLHINYQIKI